MIAVVATGILTIANLILLTLWPNVTNPIAVIVTAIAFLACVIIASRRP